MTEMQPQQVTQLKIQPQPLPTTADVAAQAMADGSLAIRLDITNPGGCSVSILSADFARQLGQMLIDAAGTAKTGLIVARNGTLPQQNGRKP